MERNKSQLTVKLASGIVAFALSASPVLAGTPNNAYAENLNTTSLTEEQYKPGTIIEHYTVIDDVEYNGYVVKAGDNTSRVSQKVTKYFNEEMTTKYWPVIAYLNEYPRTVRPGEVLIFPESFEEMDETLTELRQSGWLAKYIQYRGIYKNNKRNITVGEVIDQIYGKGASQDPTFVRNYLKAVRFDVKKFNASSELNGDLYFKLTDWIPTTEELGVEPTTVKKSNNK